MFGRRFKERARSDPWISERIRRYFSRRFTVGTNVPSAQQTDTRTHIVGELYDTEISYVDSLQTIIKKYMIPLKSSEHSAEIEGSQVDQIFCQVPEILKFHETFLETLKNRLGYWDTKQKIGDVFVDV
ncbi:DH domain-containing protein, partial [Trichonephila clavata]